MIDDELDDMVRKLDLDQKVRLLTGATAWRTHAEPDLGLRSIVVSDGPIGVRGQGWDERSVSLTLPSPSALAATWDTGLVRRLGELLAGEARRKSVDVLLAPTINLHRSPLGGRHFECYSEDPLLTARIGVAYIEGVQSRGVAATAKHYVANDSETERMTLDAHVDERTLRELYMVPFEAAVAAGVWVVMAAYNGVNGATMTENPLLADPLKGEWGFDGLVISDWGAVRSAVAAGRAPQDLAMPGPDGAWGPALAAAVRSGDVPEEAVDEKVRRLLGLAARVGALSPGSSPAVLSPAETGGLAGVTPITAEEVERGRVVLREAVAASAVLLRNEGGLLPLAPGRLRRVAVIGPNAATPRVQGGGSAGVYPVSVASPLDGIRAALDGLAEVTHAVGTYTDGHPAPLGLDNACDPRDGRPGVLVRLLGADGAEVHAEHRLTGQILEPALVRGMRTVEIRARLRPSVTGRWRVGVSGWGPVFLAADGVTLVDEDVPLDTDDPATIHLHPPYRFAELDLTEGVEVELVSRRRLSRDSGLASALAADPPRRGDADELAAAVELARDADVAIVVVGSTDESESEGYDRTDLTLPGDQDALVRAVVAANPSTVVVVNTGGPVALPWRDEVPAVLLSWFPGQEYGHGLADVLFGTTEPGGRLPTTWAARSLVSTTPAGGVLKYGEALDIGYRAWLREPEPPAYWFGHGLGYTTWAYEGITVEPGASAGAVVRILLRNTGTRAGAEVAQVYLARPGSAVSRPERWLAGYARVTAGPGEAVEAVVELPARAFQHWSVERKGWVTELGGFAVLAGRTAADLPLAASVTVGAESTGA
ncbi:glycoside hydrolase family 3 C-terminal domain-containing protein [Sphaerisporangium aureirubrum]|uniref:Glycoside hydrolase family 3 C-terminal domain-containing protein n=1 Tax=Sphaerisporangium aureirubrum TaxID=1544736 RepID=A0ABW1NGS8_9ACTN